MTMRSDKLKNPVINAKKRAPSEARTHDLDIPEFRTQPNPIFISVTL
jgi:hypothetical protein